MLRDTGTEQSGFDPDKVRCRELGQETLENLRRLHRYAGLIVSLCDGAVKDDKVGYSAWDADFGRYLADVEPERWKAKTAPGAWRVMNKYRGQLLKYFEVDMEKEPRIHAADIEREWTGLQPVRAAEKLAAERAGVHPAQVEALAKGEDRHMKLVDEGEKEYVEVVFPFDRDLVDAMKFDLKGRRFKPVPFKHWQVKPTLANLEALASISERFGLEDEGGAIQARVDGAREKADEMHAASLAESAELDLPGLGTDTGEEPFPFQNAGILFVQASKRCIVGDEMGLGKTIQALGTWVASGHERMVVVVPASLKINWRREALRWVKGLKGFQVFVCEGRKPKRIPENWTRLVIINYDILSYWLPELVKFEAQVVVADECHMIKNPQAKRTKAAMDLVGAPRKGQEVKPENPPEYRLGLTGTPFLNRPEEGIAQLQWIGRLQDMGGWAHYRRHYCMAQFTGYGMDTSGADHLDELNLHLRQTGSLLRRRKAEVLKELPAKTRARVPMEIDNRKEYKEAEDDCCRWLAGEKVKDEGFLATLEGMSDEEKRSAIRRHRNEAEWRSRNAETLVRFEALKQCAVKGKLAAAKKWISTFLASGEKLVVFAHHRNVIAKLAEAFDCPTITGDTPKGRRQEYIDRFQEDPECRLIVLNLQAGGVGITLTAASNVLMLELGWTPALMDQAEDRCHRIGQEDNVTAWYLLAEATIEEEIEALLSEKREVVEEATDGYTYTEEAEHVTDGEAITADKVSGSLMERLRAKMEAKAAGAQAGYTP